ncbi:NADAR family protein [Legionella sp. WA2022007384]
MPLSARSYKGAIKKLSGSSNHSSYQGRSDSVNVVAFDREDEGWGILSNYAEIPIKMQTPFGERTFPTVEHYFQYQKDPKDEEYLKKILKGDAQNARNLGQDKQWADFKLADEAMKRAIQAKLENPLVRKALKETENACLIEDTGSRSPQNQDGNWGWQTGGQIKAYSKTGNKLGILLMEERNRIHQQEGHPALVVQNPRDLSERARGIMTRNHSKTDLIHLSKHLPDAMPKQDSFPSSRVKNSLHQLTHNPPTPDSNKEVSTMIRTLMTTSSSIPDIPVVGKGAMNGTFKIAFDNPQDAAVFRSLLQKQGFETTYFGNNERYPMESSGKTLNHIVRFENKGPNTEIPKEALRFLKQKFNDDDRVANIIEKMGFDRPSVQQSIHP